MNTQPVGFGLGQSAHSNESVTPSSFDYKMTKFLIKAMKDQRLIDVLPANGKWANEFRLLRRNHDESEIEETLTWYCQHSRDEYVPKTASAAGFRAKFIQIRDAMQRGTEDWSTLPAVEITPMAHRISQYLGGLIWPGDEKKDELAAIQISINNYQDFLRRLRLIKQTHPQHAGLVDYLVGMNYDVPTFVEAWWSHVHQLSRSPKWGGKLARHVVHRDSERFQRIVNGWCIEYKGPGRYTDMLWGLLYEGGPHLCH